MMCIIRKNKNKSWTRIYITAVLSCLVFLNMPSAGYGQGEAHWQELSEPLNLAADSIIQDIRLVDDESKVLKFEHPVVRTAVGNSLVVDVVPINQREIMVVANEVGSTSLVVWEAGGINKAFQIFVEQDPHVLESTIKSAYPESGVEVHSLGDAFALSGEVKSLEEKERMMSLAESYAAGSVDMLNIKEPKQILIDVYFVELDRTRSKDYGQSYSYLDRNFVLNSFAGNVSGTDFQEDPITVRRGLVGAEPLALNKNATFSNAWTDAYKFIAQNVEWMESNNMLRVIAKPKLLAKDGEEAEFLVGGQFPFATVSSNGTNVQFREFGHQLKFTPKILDDGRIRLTVLSAVSELNFASTLTISGSTVPSIIENSARTVVELENHQTLVLGGFISKRTNNTKTKVPILGDIPFVGKMFQSDDNEGREHELMFIITPHIIVPMNLKRSEKEPTFYDAEEIDNVFRIEELTDSNFQADAMNTAMKNYETQRMMDQQTSREVIQPTDDVYHMVVPLPGENNLHGLPQDSSEEYPADSQEAKSPEQITPLDYREIASASGPASGVPIPQPAPPKIVGAAATIPLLNPVIQDSPPQAGQIIAASESSIDDARPDAKSEENQMEPYFEPVIARPAAMISGDGPVKMQTVPSAGSMEQRFVPTMSTQTVPAQTLVQNPGSSLLPGEQNQDDIEYAKFYRPMRSYEPSLYKKPIEQSQSEKSSPDFSSRFYRPVEDLPMAKSENLPVDDPLVKPADGGSAYNAGMRNFRLPEQDMGPSERANFRREQERLDRFFGNIASKRG